MGLLCGCVIGLSVLAIVALAFAGAPAEAYVATGGIGTALAVTIRVYLRR